MQRQSWAIYLAVVAMFPVASRAEDMVGKVKKAVERTTLDQNGMAPFHLKAVLAPSFERGQGLRKNRRRGNMVGLA